MTGSTGTGLALALASTAALNWAFLRQHGAVSQAPPLSIRRPIRFLWLLFTNLRWLVGFAIGLAGWALYISALRLAPLSLVQAVSAGGIGLLALLIERTTAARLTRRDWIGVALAVTGLVLLAVSLAGRSGTGTHGSSAAVLGWVALSLLVAALAAWPLSACLAGGAGFGVAAGALYAAGDVATKAAVTGGAAAWLAVVVLGCHGLAFVSLQLGFQRGGALATVGLSSLLTNALPIVAGAALFAEGLPEGPLGVVRLVAFACVVGGAAMLARPEGDDETLPAPAGRVTGVAGRGLALLAFVVPLATVGGLARRLGDARSTRSMSDRSSP